MTPRYLESDDQWAKLIEYLRQHTPLKDLGGPECHQVFACLRRLGYRLQEPEKHPSGIETTEAATTTVVGPAEFHKLARTYRNRRKA